MTVSNTPAPTRKAQPLVSVPDGARGRAKRYIVNSAPVIASPLRGCNFFGRDGELPRCA